MTAITATHHTPDHTHAVYRAAVTDTRTPVTSTQVSYDRQAFTVSNAIYRHPKG